MPSVDRSQSIGQAVKRAAAEGMHLRIAGGGSKAFYGRAARGRELDVASHRGIVNYQPSELVVTARCGTTLSDLNGVLAEQGQMLAFEPPMFADEATLGGTVACGFSGSRRPYTGAARDFVLGCRIVDGRGEILSFGGEVMKNVAGYDVSRLMVGALGTLGVLLQISLKVLPLPECESTRVFELDTPEALAKMQQLSLQPLPCSGMSYDGERLFVRLSGAERAVAAAGSKIGGDPLADGEYYWRQLNEQRMPFFRPGQPLWRLSVPPATAPLPLAGAWYLDWGGALRWLKSGEPAAKIFAASAAVNGHATLFRDGDRSGHVFQPMSGTLQRLQRNLKQAFDPHGILNPQRMYRDW